MLQRPEPISIPEVALLSALVLILSISVPPIHIEQRKLDPICSTGQAGGPNMDHIAFQSELAVSKFVLINSLLLRLT